MSEVDVADGSPAPRHAVLVDLNVILDVLTRREPHYEVSASVWAAVEEHRLRGLVAAHSVTTLDYLLHRHLSRSKANGVIRNLLTVFSVAGIDEDVLLEALSYGWQDFEDGVQMAAAAQASADFVITRNPKDFAGGPVPVLQPAELPAILEAPQ